MILYFKWICLACLLWLVNLPPSPKQFPEKYGFNKSKRIVARPFFPSSTPSLHVITMVFFRLDGLNVLGSSGWWCWSAIKCGSWKGRCVYWKDLVVQFLVGKWQWGSVVWYFHSYFNYGRSTRLNVAGMAFKLEDVHHFFLVVACRFLLREYGWNIDKILFNFHFYPISPYPTGFVDISSDR